MIDLKTVLVATDFGDASRAALSYARDVAEVFSSTLHIVHVIPDRAARDLPVQAIGLDVAGIQLDEEAQARERLGNIVDDNLRAKGAITTLLTAASPATAIIDYARDHAAELIVMGTHGRSGFADLFMGAVAQHVVRRAPCPVLTLRAEPASRIDRH